MTSHDTRTVEYALIAGMLGGFALLWAGLFAAVLVFANVPDARSGTLFALFAPGTAAEQALATIVAAGGNPVRNTGYGFVWIAQSGDPGFAGALRRGGALAVYDKLPFGPPPVGCLGLVTTDARSADALVR